MENLAEFKQLENLVLDENQLTSNSVFPKLEKLHTLWVNANNIEDLQPFLENINVNLPNLSYLSMYKNPACPNFFTGKQVEEYQRYRYKIYLFYSEIFLIININFFPIFTIIFFKIFCITQNSTS